MLRRRTSSHAAELYRDLIAQCSSEPVQDVIAGQTWTLVRTEQSVGLALSPLSPRGTSPSTPEGHFHLRGKPLIDLAELSLSWDPREAAIGIAAINAACNIPERFRDLEETEGQKLLLKKATGKKVGVVGHFPFVEKLRAAGCCVTVFEYQQQEGDLPAAAEEYLLPEQDIVAITGCALTNHSLPRLLELSRPAWTMLIGPSTPLSVILFDYGVDALAGCIATDPDALAEVVREGGGVHDFRSCVRFITLRKPR